MTPLLFNPTRTAPGELESMTVGPAALVDDLEEALLRDSAGPAPRHWLLVGARGVGKTHVTELVVRRIRTRAGWSVVRVPEQALRVQTLVELLGCLVSALDDENRPPSKSGDAGQRIATAEAWLRRWRAERGPVLVVLENVQEWLGRRLDRAAQARLRAILMGDPPFVLLATGTRQVEGELRHADPFYDFFQVRRLEDLDVAGAVALVRARAVLDGARDLTEDPRVLREHIEELFHLTGGNPRVLLAFYGVLRRGPLRELPRLLLQLLDTLSPYYAARLRDASPQELRVLAEMAVADGPLTPSEIGRRVELATNKVTAVLAGLEAADLVRPGGRPTDKRARYWEVRERLFRIWLALREEGDDGRTMRSLLSFYASWYEDDDDAPGGVLMVREPATDRAGWARAGPPWSAAAAVATAQDREAALSALHPEVRDAVLLLLGPG